MIKSCIDGKWKVFDSLHEALGLQQDKQSVISLVGGGGKTTTMCRLQKEYELTKIPSIVTTTTHIQSLEEEWFLGEPSIDGLKERLETFGKVWCGEVTKKGKLQSFPESFLREMISLGDSVIIEADGARRLPCKAPGPSEPVLVPETTMVLALYGMDALGKQIKEICFRPELVADLLEKSEEDVLAPSDIAVLAASERGGRKSVTSKMDYQVILNKADGKKEQDEARQIAVKLMNLGVTRVHVTDHLLDISQFKFGKLKI